MLSAREYDIKPRLLYDVAVKASHPLVSLCAFLLLLNVSV